MKNLIVLILLIFFSLTTFAQVDLEKIIDLLNQGKTQEAISLLESRTKLNSKDAESWNLLGLAYFQEKNYKQSQKSYEKAIKLNPQSEVFQTNLALTFVVTNNLSNAEKAANKAIQINPKYSKAYYVRGTLNLWKEKYDKALADSETAIQIDSTYSNAYSLKSDVLIYWFGEHLAKGEKASENLDFLLKSTETLEKCKQICKDNLSLVEDKLEAVKAFTAYFEKRNDITSLSQPEPQDPSLTPLRMLSKPKPGYTDSARQNNITGTIKLAVYFSSTGVIKYILVIKPLKGGLTENAIKAARGIKFEPQKKDGNPVSVIKIVEYTFTIY